MSKQIEFFFDFGSPTTYLAWTQLPRLAAAHGASIAWRPMLLGGVFKATGNHSPIEVPAKGATPSTTWRAMRNATACRWPSTRPSRSTP